MNDQSGDASVSHEAVQRSSAPFTNPLGTPKHRTGTLDVVDKVEQILIWIYFFIAALLLFRFVLSLFGASQGTLFVEFVFGLTSPFMFPFEGMFGGPFGIEPFYFEFEIIFALIVYALVFFGIARLVRIIFK